MPYSTSVLTQNISVIRVPLVQTSQTAEPSTSSGTTSQYAISSGSTPDLADKELKNMIDRMFFRIPQTQQQLMKGSNINMFG